MPATDSQAYAANHYRTNRDRYAEATRKSRARRIAKLRSLKAKPCEDCGREYHPNVMQFHHRDPSVKEGTIGTVMSRWGWKRIEEEITKCVLLCANCHILRHVRCEESESWDSNPQVLPASEAGGVPDRPDSVKLPN